ncbi:ABC transporter permease [Bdellovibrio sp. HCB290]|uniref:ABC transporter permease n=1 Tax=Bdellovibrio sp. HCB290 TaxID=3394356 RepID=UPI0039B4A06D
MRGSVWAVAVKEVFQIVRDPFTMAVAIVMPIVMVLFFGFAIEFNMDKIPLAIFDGSKTVESRILIDSFVSSKYFVPKAVYSPAHAIETLDGGRSKTALIIKPEFARNLTPYRQSEVQILIDGADNSSAGSVIGYLAGVQQLSMKKLFPAADLRNPVEIHSRFLFNPELNSQWFVVPGLAAVIIAVLSILLTALTVAREWENGSMELLLGTPVRPFAIIVGKLLPYAVMGIVSIIFVFMMSKLVFDVPFRGSFILYMLSALIFLCTYLAQGLLISVLTRSQQLSMQFAMLSGLLPSMLLSGFIFPTEHMPPFFYYFTMILPARWFIEISRQLFLQGSGFMQILPSFGMLCLLLLVLLAIATKKFKKDVEP